MRSLYLTLAALLLTTGKVSASGLKDFEFKPVSFTQEEIENAEREPRKYSLDPKSVRIVKIKDVPAEDIDIGLLPPENGAALPGAKGPVDVPIDIINEIINIGEKIWGIIDANKPVVDISTTYANAWPRGIEHWTDMHSWKAPVATMYEFRAKNLLGQDAVTVRYQVIRMNGGKYKGHGEYLNHVTIEPLTVNVLWGMKFSMVAAIPSVMNVGTTQDPVAGMLATLKWQVNTVLEHSQGTSVYYMQGDGDYREIGGPIERELQKNAHKLDEVLKLPTTTLDWN